MIKMTRFLKGAGAVSVLILAYGAHANGGFEIAVSNQFPHLCRIIGSPVYNVNSTAAVTSTQGGSATIDFGSGFANADAAGRQISGSLRLTVFTTAQCNYALTSAYGALKNVTAGQTGAFRDYYADAHDASGSGTLVHLNSLSSDTAVNQFAVAAPSGWGIGAVAIEFNIPQTSTPLAAGQYQDILSLTVNPSV